MPSLDARQAVRENVNGAIGSFETGVIVPELKQAPVKVSSVILSTQLQAQDARGRSDNPLIRDGMQIVPNVTHVVGRDQKLFFYFEVYEPGLYTCQVNVIDAAAGKFVFPRLAMLVR